LIYALALLLLPQLLPAQELHVPDAPGSAATAAAAPAASGTCPDRRPFNLDISAVNSWDLVGSGDHELAQSVLFIVGEAFSCTPSATQGLASRLTRLVHVALMQGECRSIGMGYATFGGMLVMGTAPPCTGDNFHSIFLHEMTHLVTWQASESRGAPCRSGRFHDVSVLDRDDQTLLLAMDARTDPGCALNEGVADAVSLALVPRPNFHTHDLTQVEQEALSSSWRELSWRDQQANEYFVMAVLTEYLGMTDQAVTLERLDHILEVYRTRSPRSLQQLLQALMDRDPVGDKDRIDAVLRRMNSRWNSEIEDLHRAQRESSH
jgi:hypothetical protein